MLTALHVAGDVSALVAHGQVVLTVPKRLHLHTRFDRKLLSQLCSGAWTCLQADAPRMLARDNVQLDVGATIQTHGDSAL